jgi:hypothetical protein
VLKVFLCLSAFVHVAEILTNRNLVISRTCSLTLLYWTTRFRFVSVGKLFNCVTTQSHIVSWRFFKPTEIQKVKVNLPSLFFLDPFTYVGRAVMMRSQLWKLPLDASGKLDKKAKRASFFSEKSHLKGPRSRLFSRTLSDTWWS